MYIHRNETLIYRNQIRYDQKSCNSRKVFKWIALLQIVILVYYSKRMLSYISTAKWITLSYFEKHNLSNHITFCNNSEFLMSNRVFESHTIGIVFINLSNNSGINPHVCERANESRIVPNSIAMGLAITSRGIVYATREEIMSRFPVFKTLIPSFCKTITLQYSYNFFFAYDSNDEFFNKDINLKIFVDILVEVMHKYCPSNSNFTVYFVQCSHSGQPAKAQNDAMMEAYMSNMEYYYRVNDDSNLITPGWTGAFIKTLKSYNPPNIGVVGPKHSGGNEAILTYDFVHYSHIEIFGFYYPRVFTGWFADNWITEVYKPDRCRKLDIIQLTHTLEKGTRYAVDLKVGDLLMPTVKKANITLQSYIDAFRSPKIKKLTVSDKVVSMSLSGQTTKYTYGAIRNAQLMRVHFPDWKMRIYIPPKNSSDVIPFRVINKLKLLGVQLINVGPNLNNVNSTLWKYLIFDDKKVNSLLIRNTENRLNKHLLSMQNIQKLTNKGNRTQCFCMFYSKDNVTLPSVDGFIGCNSQPLQQKDTIQKLLIKTSDQTDFRLDTFISKVIWPKIENITSCYHFVSKNSTDNSTGTTDDNIDSVFNEFEQVVFS